MEEIRSNYECGAQKLYFKKYFYKNEDNYDILKKFKLKKNICIWGKNIQNACKSC